MKNSFLKKVWKFLTKDMTAFMDEDNSLIMFVVKLAYACFFSGIIFCLTIIALSIITIEPICFLYQLFS